MPGLPAVLFLLFLSSSSFANFAAVYTPALLVNGSGWRPGLLNACNDTFKPFDSRFGENLTEVNSYRLS